MKKYKLIILLLMMSLGAFAQVGIGTNTPTAGSILELKAADKALLLTRVANTAAVTTPVNGMMVYDISSNCIKGYQNGAWTGCLSACSGSSISGGGDLGLDFTFTMKQIDYNSGMNNAACVTTDGKVFVWGRNFLNEFVVNAANVASSTYTDMFTPVYLPLPTGELASKIGLGSYGMLALTTTGNVYAMGKTQTGNGDQNIFGGFALPRVWTKVVVAGEATFTNIQVSPGQTYLLGSSGKVYRSGLGNTSLAPDQATLYTAILFPAGVTSYTNIWCDIPDHDSNRNTLFLKGNNGSIYVIGSNSGSGLGIGIPAAAFGTDIDFNLTPVIVPFPAGVNIVKISVTSLGMKLALSATGTAYGWGQWRTAFIGQPYLFAATPAPADIFVQSGISYITKPSPITLPTGYGDTKFTDVLAGNAYSAVRTDKMVYFKGYNAYGILANPVINDDANYGSQNSAGPGYIIDAVTGSTYSQAAPTLNKFKTFIMIGISSQSFAFGISQADRGYSWGYNNFGSLGLGGGYLSGHIAKPTPISTGIGDPTNPNPLY